MSQLGISLLQSRTGPLLADLGARAQGLVMGSNVHGFSTLNCYLPCALDEAFFLQYIVGRPHVVADDDGYTAWVGRVEDIAMAPGGVRIAAYGYWRALYDTPFTGMYSTKRMDGFKAMTGAGMVPERYSIDQNGRLYIGLVKGNIYGSGGDAGAQIFKAPHLANTKIEHFSVTLSYVLPANWTIWLLAWNEGLVSGVTSVITTTGGTAGPLTHDWDLSATPRDWVAVYMFNSSGASPAFAGETGSNYLTISDLRMKATASSSVFGDEIARDLAAHINGSNPTQLSASTVLIDSPALDLKEETYEDMYPADILDRLANVGDNSSPAQLFEAMVWEQGLVFRKRLSAVRRHWYVDADALNLEATLETLRNSVYTDYQETTGRKLRTAITSDADSIARAGLTRRIALQSPTTSATDAVITSDLGLNDRKNPKPRASLPITALYDDTGTRWPLWYARAGDRITIRNLPATLGTEVDRIRTFLIFDLLYNGDSNTLDVTPEAHRPRLDLFFLRRAAGVY